MFQVETLGRPLRSRLSQDQSFSEGKECAFTPIDVTLDLQEYSQITCGVKTMGLVTEVQKAEVFLMEEGCRGPCTFSSDLSCNQEQV